MKKRSNFEEKNSIYPMGVVIGTDTLISKKIQIYNHI
jgi:hypothetical protein